MLSYGTVLVCYTEESWSQWKFTVQQWWAQNSALFQLAHDAIEYYLYLHIYVISSMNLRSLLYWKYECTTINNCNLPGISMFTINELPCLFIWTWLLTTVWNCPSSPGPTWCGAIPTLWTSDTAPGTTTPIGIWYSGFNPPLNSLRPSYRIPSIGNICPMILRVYCSSSLLIMVCCFNICEI